jgi:hypothetical protein
MLLSLLYITELLFVCFSIQHDTAVQRTLIHLQVGTGTEDLTWWGCSTVTWSDTINKSQHLVSGAYTCRQFEIK